MQPRCGVRGSPHARRGPPRLGALSVLAAATCAAAGALLRSTCFGFVGRVPQVPVRGRTLADATVERSVAVGASPADGPQGSEAKVRLLDVLEDPEVQAEVLKSEGRPVRGRVDEAINRVERLNPTEEPVYSELLDGAWQVKYSSSYAPGLLSSPTRELAFFLYSGGFSLANALSSFANGYWGQTVGLRVDAKTVRISEGRTVEASLEVELAGRRETLSHKAELLPLSSARMSEEILELQLPEPLGDQPPPLELRRTLLVTYLDEELMIVRDESGAPEVLVRELVPVATEAALFPGADSSVAGAEEPDANATSLATDNGTAVDAGSV